MLNINPREKKFILFGILIVVLAIGYKYFFTPYLERWQSTTVQIQQMKIRLTRGKQLQSNPLDSTYSRNTIQNQTTAIASLLENLESWSDRSGMKILTIKPGPVQDKPQMRELNFDVEMNGNLDSLCHFVEFVEQPATLVRINKFRISKSREDSRNLSVVLSISTLSFPEVKIVKISTNTHGDFE